MLLNCAEVFARHKNGEVNYATRSEEAASRGKGRQGVHFDLLFAIDDGSFSFTIPMGAERIVDTMGSGAYS